MIMTAEELQVALDTVPDPVLRGEISGAVSRFLSTTPEFYPSRTNLTKLFTGMGLSGASGTDVQTYRDVYSRLKTNNALEAAPGIVEAPKTDAVDADGFTEEDRQRAKARLAVRQERAIYNMSADEYRKQTPELGRKHAR